MNKILTISSIALGLFMTGCATTRQPTLATPCFQASAISGFAIEAEDKVVVNDGHQFWRLHLRGSCPELKNAATLMFSDEQELKTWPNQPWRHGYGMVKGWPEQGHYVNRSSDLMRVCSNRMSWAHPISASGAPMTGEHASFGCRVDDVEPLWR